MPSPVPFHKVRKQLEDAGWWLERITGSHHHFKHDKVAELVTIAVHKNLVKYCYVRDTEKAITKSKEAEAAEDQG